MTNKEDKIKNQNEIIILKNAHARAWPRTFIYFYHCSLSRVLLLHYTEDAAKCQKGSSDSL